MKVLLTGFDREATDRLSAILRDGGHQVLGATGRSSSRTLARVASPEGVVLPAGPAGDTALEWVEDLLGAAVVVRATRDGGGLEGLGGDGAPAAIPAGPPAPLEAAPPPVEERRPRPPEDLSPTLPMLGVPGDLREERSTLPPPARLPAPAAAVAPAVRAAAESLGPDLQAKLRQVRFADYHTLLEVDRAATAYTIREQYQRLRALYTPSGWPWPVEARDIPDLDEIGAGLEDAYTMLGDAGLRARYERALDDAAAAAPRR